MKSLLVTSLLVALAAVGVVAGGALASHTTQTEEHVVPFTVGDVTGQATITDADALPHETITVTETVTVTEPPTTTEPPPTTTEPPPSDGETIIRSSQYVCRGAVNIALLRITMSNGSQDAVQFREDCSGRIARLEVSGTFADCLKVNPVSPAPHDVTIESGYCRADAPPSSGVHQDCIQAGGGRDFAISRFVFDCLGGGGGNYFIASFNGGTPQRFVCTGCAFGPRHPNQIRTPSDPASGVRDSLVCQSLSGRQTYGPASGDMGGNVSPAASDPRCTFEGLLAYVGG